MNASGIFRTTVLCGMLMCGFQQYAHAAGDDMPEGLPDLEPVDLYRVDGRLKAALLNHGLSFAGEVDLRVVASESLVPTPQDYAQDRTVTVPLRIGTGGVAVVDIGRMNWPGSEHPAIDHPQLHVGVRVDPQAKIPERSRRNNSIERTLRIPCEVSIERAEQKQFQEGLPALLILHGRFGSLQKSKGVVLRGGGRESQLLIAEWGSGELKAVLPRNIPAGRYEVLVQCSERQCGQGYFTSNAIEITVTVDP